eukprot:CAMPEP_0176303102 /NCGR_PEP_ID=MMETSP0121_2-20121125/61729_1 /TAXON_ID=160619 /ORGANISM="Kryptoperidinium foliaceum, Strain CCMP 1326" /LENGTH=136 /DNA_ID=CAMNT_0017644641 /DNA_START=3 /DNA_END=411 /DNA_ORIENTATION=-
MAGTLAEANSQRPHAVNARDAHVPPQLVDETHRYLRDQSADVQQHLLQVLDTPRSTARRKNIVGSSNSSSSSHDPALLPGVTSSNFGLPSSANSGKYICNSAKKEAKTTGGPSRSNKSHNLTVAANGQELELSDRK